MDLLALQFEETAMGMLIIARTNVVAAVLLPSPDFIGEVEILQLSKSAIPNFRQRGATEIEKSRYSLAPLQDLGQGRSGPGGGGKSFQVPSRALQFDETVTRLFCA